jgi:hypothetical protein
MIHRKKIRANETRLPPSSAGLPRFGSRFASCRTLMPSMISFNGDRPCFGMQRTADSTETANKNC